MYHKRILCLVGVRISLSSAVWKQHFKWKKKRDHPSWTPETLFFSRKRITMLFAMKSVHIDTILLLFCVFSASSGDVFRPPENERTDSQEGVDNGHWHPDWDKVVGCERGERHSRFPACWCGEYAQVVKDAEIQALPLDELETEGYHFKRRGNRKIYYICLPCSICPDGVLMTGKCRQSQDTSCDLNQCSNPDHIFDHGKKACIPDSREQLPEHEEKKEGPTMMIVLEKATVVGPTKGVIPMSNTGAATGKLTDEDPWHKHAVIILVIALMIVPVNIALFMYVFRRKRKRHRTMTRIPSNLSQATTQTGCTCMQETPV